ncbi:MAG: hypothetical protein JBO36_17720 [Candidatus Thiodiazotropha taylori]|nr:hypothetical protein [Candidatus Thiodiazotropha taylori]
MNIFLQILGTIFLALLLIGAYFAWKLYRFVKRQQNSDIAKATSVLPSQVMDLEPSNRDQWKEREKLDYCESELKSIGASHVGYYFTHSGFAMIRISLWNFKNQVIAAIYEGSTDINQKDVRFIFEVACKLTDGSLCITSNQHALYDSRPDNHIIQHNESNSILEFIKALKREIPENTKLIKIPDPLEFFIESYEDATEWSWSAEQLKSEKTQQVLASIGVTVTDELMDDLIESGRSYSVEVNVNRARRKLARHSQMSVEKWDKISDKLVFINEKMEVSHLIDAVYDIAGDITDEQEQVLDGFQQTTEKLTDPIGAFQMLLSSMDIKAKRITSMETPVKTEVYLPL